MSSEETWCVEDFKNPNGPLPDVEIRARMNLVDRNPFRLRINGFSEPTKTPKMVSYGLSSYGYDFRCGTRFLLFDNTMARVVDPLEDMSGMLKEIVADKIIIPPNSYCLAETVEHFEMPEDVIGVIYGKSTYARCGIALNCTIIEPGWRGKITIEVANQTPLPAAIHANMGLGQIVFFAGNPCEVPYNKKKNPSYQDQSGVSVAKVFTEGEI